MDYIYKYREKGVAWFLEILRMITIDLWMVI